MAAYYRQCPNCGGQTKESVCEICGRRTIVTNRKYDDTEDAHAQVPEQPLRINTPDKKRQRGHIQAMLQEGRNYRKQPQIKTGGNANRKFVGIFFAVLIAILAITIMMDSEESPDRYDEEFFDEEVYDTLYNTIDQQRNYLEDYLVPVSSDAVLTCEIDAKDKTQYYVYNPSPYIYYAGIQLETDTETDYSEVYNGAPYDFETSYTWNDADSCTVSHAEFSDLNLYKTDISYRFLYDDNYVRELHIDQKISDDEMENLLKRVYCINLLTYHYYDERMNVILEGELIYNIIFDYETGDICIQDIESGDMKHIFIDLL